jgi:hypothetical protein
VVLLGRPAVQPAEAIATLHFLLLFLPMLPAAATIITTTKENTTITIRRWLPV